jgi:asparagine synthase (glutamine-hydrolysing)
LERCWDADIKMCGIAGELRFDGNESDLKITKVMCDTQIHRGPDDEGYYSRGPVSLGIRRLSIIDLTKGLYPIQNEKGTIHLVFNGEIYGFDSLRVELEEHGHRFRSKTDTETLVHAYEEWGTACLDRLNGMFAFALWDEQERLLWIGRDPFGIKPLYYHNDQSVFAFASEIKPLLARPDLHRRPNDRVVCDYVRSGRVDDTPYTFFEGVKRLLPGHHLLIRPSGTMKLERYWTPKISRELNGDMRREEVEKTRRLFLDAVTRQLVSDVPVGTCLSGGIDSSSLVCAIRKVHPKGSASTGQWIKTFSAVFPGHPIDESKCAKTVCEVAQAEYNPVQPTAAELWRDLRDLVKCQEEPFASTSIYAQYRVMKRAKERGITVLLDGQGSDELLCGYVPLYLHYLMTLNEHGKYLTMVRETIRSHDLVHPLIKTRVLAYLKRFLAHGSSMYSRLTSTRNLGTHSNRTRGDDLHTALEVLTTMHGLPALLRYEDKNSMWHSIEARVPFLDRPFFEYVASLPLNRKLCDGWTKNIFRRAMAGILPEDIRLRRTKIGFETPEKNWIQMELRDSLQEFFKSDLTASKFYNADALRKLLWKPILTVNETSLIWRVLNLEMWYREFFLERSR